MPEQDRMQISGVMGRVRELFYDGCRFIQRNMGMIRSRPMHIHYSALPFAPQDTAVFRTYGGSGMGGGKVVHGSERTWNSVVAVLRGHSEVNCVMFSPDNSTLASASNDQTVRLWDSRTGALIATLEGHSS